MRFSILAGYIAFVVFGVDGRSSSEAVAPALKLGLLLPVSGSWTAGRTIAGAAALAVKRINDDAGLLGGMRVEYVWVDAGFTVSAGNEAIAKLLANKDIDAFFGPGKLTFIRCAVVRRLIDALAVVQQATQHARRRCGTSSSSASAD